MSGTMLTEPTSEPDTHIAALRARIDEIDATLIRLWQERAAISQEVGSTRVAAEQRAAAEAVGVTRIEFLEGYADGTLTPSLQLRRDLTRVVRRYRPDRILTSSPLRRWERIAGPGHPDHLAVGEAVTCAVYPDARNPFAFPELLLDEGLQPWVVREVWFHGGPDPDHV